MDDKTRLAGIADMEKVRNQRRVMKALNNLVEEARNGTLGCAAIRSYYKDGSSEVKVIEGTPEEQAEALARLEAEEAKAKVLIEEPRPILDGLRTPSKGRAAADFGFTGTHTTCVQLFV